MTAWRLAGMPTKRSPPSTMAMMEGVVRAPSAFSMTRGADPSMTETQELVVPRSMPIISPASGPSELNARDDARAAAGVAFDR